MRIVFCGLAAGLLGLVPIQELAAQSLGNVIKREAERETRRQAQQRTREAVQCATGARDCLPDNPGASPASAAPAGGASAGFSVAAIPGASPTDREGGTMATYRRITGFKPKLISYQDHTGVVTRTRYKLTDGETPSAMITAWREPLLRQGFQIEWQCSRKAQCGSSAYHQLGAGYVPVNGINLGIAGDVEYFTARRTIEGEPTIYVAIALNRTVAYVDVIEVAP